MIQLQSDQMLAETIAYEYEALLRKMQRQIEALPKVERELLSELLDGFPHPKDLLGNFVASPDELVMGYRISLPTPKPPEVDEQMRLWRHEEDLLRDGHG